MSEKFDVLVNYNNNLIFKSSQSENELLKKNSALKEEREKLHTQLSADIYIEETLNILVEMKLK